MLIDNTVGYSRTADKWAACVGSQCHQVHLSPVPLYTVSSQCHQVHLSPVPLYTVGSQCHQVHLSPVTLYTVGSQCHQVHLSPVPQYKCLPNKQIMKTVQLPTWLFLVQCTRVGTVSSVCCLLEGHTARGLQLTARSASFFTKHWTVGDPQEHL